MSTAAARTPASPSQPKLLPSPPLPDPLSNPPRQSLASHAHNIHTPPSIPSSPISQHPPPANASRAGNGLSRAEAYASAHQPRRSKEALAIADKGKQRAHVKETSETRTLTGGQASGGAGGGSKPIFDWISRKLGAGRRASIAEPLSAVAGPSTVRAAANDGRNGRYTSLPRKVRTGGMEPPVPPMPQPNSRAGPSAPRPTRQLVQPKASGRAVPNPRLTAPLPAANLRPRLSPINIFPQTPGRDSILSRSESHSLQSYSVLSASPTERERRREANNPYPSMPIHMYKGSIMSSSASAWASASGIGERSVSFRTRSRTPSVRSGRSISSSLRPRLNLSRDALSGGKEEDSERSSRVVSEGDIILNDEYDGSGLRTPMGADENASIRPLPPSHPPSPTPSHSMLSRSASGSLLSPVPGGSRFVASPYRPPPSGYPSSSSVDVTSEGYDDGSDRPDMQSRRDSASTKPTTIISFDSGPGVAYIAQVAAAPLAPPLPLPPVVADTNAVAGPSTPAGGSTPRTTHSSPSSSSPIASPLPASPLRTSLSQDNALPSQSPSTSSLAPPVDGTPPPQFQAQPPKHSHPHPIHNPRPSSPPNDNASILTLASSTFAAPQPHYTASVHRPSSISRYSMISNYAVGGPSVPPSATMAVGSIAESAGQETSAGANVRPAIGTSPSVTFAPIRTSTHEAGPGHRPSSLAPSHLSNDLPSDPRRPPSIASPLGEKEYQPSLHPTMGTRGSASIWHGGRVDEGASTRAVRRRGSDNSVGSFESRWSWRGGAGSVSPVVGMGRRMSEALSGDVSRNGSMVR